MKDLKKERNYWIDNVKFILILLVVIGHLISPMRSDSEILKYIYTIIYIFHMPCFILISGYIARKVRQPKKYLLNLIILYVVFQTIQLILDYYLNQSQQFRINYVNAKYGLWFLLGMIAWYLLVRLFSTFKYPVIISIIVGTLAGYESNIGGYLALSRILSFFPFYLIGYQYDLPHMIQSIKNKRFILIVLTIIVFCISGAIYFNIDNIDYGWLYNDTPYKDLVSHSLGGIIRGIIYITSAIYIVLFLCIVPVGKNIISKYGADTLSIYLIHLLIVKIVKKTEFYTYIDTPLDNLLLILGASMLTIVLGQPIFSKAIRKLIENISKQLIKE